MLRNYLKVAFRNYLKNGGSECRSFATTVYVFSSHKLWKFQTQFT